MCDRKRNVLSLIAVCVSLKSQFIDTMGIRNIHTIRFKLLNDFVCMNGEKKTPERRQNSTWSGAHDIFHIVNEVEKAITHVQRTFAIHLKICHSMQKFCIKFFLFVLHKNPWVWLQQHAYSPISYSALIFELNII